MWSSKLVTEHLHGDLREVFRVQIEHPGQFDLVHLTLAVCTYSLGIYYQLEKIIAAYGKDYPLGICSEEMCRRLFTPR